MGPTTPLSRRETLLAALALPLVISACRSGKVREESLEEIQDSLHSSLTKLAPDSEEAELLLSICSELEEASSEFVAGHLAFIEESGRLMTNRAVSSERIQAVLEANVTSRALLYERLLFQQHRIKRALGPERWSELVADLNDPERMERVLGRRS